MPSAVPWPDVARELDDIRFLLPNRYFGERIRDSLPCIAVRQDTQFPVRLIWESLGAGWARSEEPQLIGLIVGRHVWLL